MALDPREIPLFATDATAKLARRTLVSESTPLVKAMIGCALGDALGFGVEMQTAPWIRRLELFEGWPSNPVLLPKYAFNNVRGMYSDDAEMTIGLMNALREHGVSITVDGMLSAWKAEYELASRRPAPAVAGAGRQGHGSVKTYFNGGTLDAVRTMQAARVYPGNAPPMRSMPLAFFDSPTRAKLCETNANTTHPHPKARAASFLMATATRHMVVDGGAQADVLGTALAGLVASKLSEAETEAHLRAVDALPDYHAFGVRFEVMPAEVQSLLCGEQPVAHFNRCGDDGKQPLVGLWTDSMHTIGVVLYFLKFHRGLRDVLTAALDIGGDVDSVAALCASVVGGSVGLDFGSGPSQVPWRFLEDLEGVEYLVAKATAFDAWLRDNGHPVPT